jgi:DNA invertase Pin-like site-specific DNA recombinase
MLTAIDRGEADVIVAWSLDRLQRNRRDELKLYELCKARRATLSLINGPELDFTTATGEMVADQLGMVARFEVRMKSDRQVRQQEQAATNGQRVGGRRPFGYEQDGLTVRQYEARAVVGGYDSLLAGVPLAQIARDWNAAGHVTGQARWKGEHKGEPSPWRADSVRAVLLNPRYAGKRAHKGAVVADAVWPALVDEGTWRAAAALLSDPTRRSGPRGSARALLSSLALCGVCGAPVQSGGAARPGTRGYRCSGSTGHFARKAEPVEEFVSAVMIERLSRPDAAALLVDHKKPDVDALRTQAVAIRQRLDALANDFADGSLTASQLRTATSRARARLSDVESQMADAGRVDVLGPLVGAQDVCAAWDGLSVARRRAVIDTLATVRLHPVGRGSRTFRPETVEIEWKA